MDSLTTSEQAGLDLLLQAVKQFKPGSASDDELASVYGKYIDYGVPVKESVRTICRHHGITPAQTDSISDDGVRLKS